jgi:hypothetical protein
MEVEVAEVVAMVVLEVGIVVAVRMIVMVGWQYWW